jgi:hypothetical protein
MSQLNANTPYIECKLRKEFTGLDYDINGYIFGVKSIINYPLLFHFQTEIGANVWNQPISAFQWKDDYDILDLNEEKRLTLLESWDAQSYSISTITFKFLQNKRVDVFCRDGKWRSGRYLFTIDDYAEDPNTIDVGYSEDLDSKCFHFIQLDDGNFCIQPNNLIRWHNPDYITPYDKDSPPKFKINSTYMSSENIDMTYANSPYYIYRAEKID